MKNTNIIRISLFGIALLLLANSVFAAPVIRKSVGASGPDLDAAYFKFVADLGGTLHQGKNSYTTGSRQITWDEVPNNFAGLLPNDYYNTTVPNGVKLSSDCTSDGFSLSSKFGNQSNFRFSNLNLNYLTAFKSHLGDRLFSAIEGGCNIVEVYFYIPGTDIPATVNGFGAMFTDVDNNKSALITYYGINGEEIIPVQTANGFNNGLSFLGVAFNAGERVAHVRINLGTAPLGALDKSNGGSGDVVVMDTILYGEPRAIGQHKSDFDGDGISDYAFFRPSNGFWYVISSGTNTYSQLHFGMLGDIPIDGDFDGDSRNDFAVFRPSNGTWYILRTLDGKIQVTQLGQAGDKPVAGDYDKDGKTDIAVWRPSTGTYYYLRSSNGQLTTMQFGANGDIPIGASNP